MGLKKDEKLFLITRLACFGTPSDVATEFAEIFGQAIDRRSVWIYDAASPANRARLSEELVEVFDQTRAKFQAEVESIPIANKAYRLAQLQKLYDMAKAYGNVKQSAAMLEQGAKEVGGAFTNRTELTGKDGAPIAVKTEASPVDISKLNKDELAAWEELMVKARGLSDAHPDPR
ncbi:DUF2280 domain-containing protein [bacterium]|nr:MAG: DUF2280 domain-containing protein [bacterium]